MTDPRPPPPRAGWRAPGAAAPGPAAGTAAATAATATVAVINSEANRVLAEGVSVAPTERLLAALHTFAGANMVPRSSANFARAQGDDLAPLLGVIGTLAPQRDEALALACLQVAKILSRKAANRMAFGRDGIASIVQLMHAPIAVPLACECASVILNVCYEKANVEHVLECNGLVPLCMFLTTKDTAMQAVTCGAIQSICFQAAGRKVMRSLGAIPEVVSLLSSPDVKVQSRAVGAVHNITTDASSIPIIRQSRGIGPLVNMLRSPFPGIASSAAGAVQNISREIPSRTLIRDAGAVEPLTALLFGADVQAQACAVGALLNILSPELGEDVEAPKRKHFRKAVTQAIVTSMIFHGFYTDEDDVASSADALLSKMSAPASQAWPDPKEADSE